MDQVSSVLASEPLSLNLGKYLTHGFTKNDATPGELIIRRVGQFKKYGLGRAVQP